MHLRKSLFPSLALLAGLIGCGNEPPSNDVPDAGSGSDAAPDAGPDAAPGIETPFTDGVSTLAGFAEAGDVDGTRAYARFANPVNVAYRGGMVYVADFDNGKLRAIDADTHVTATVIGLAEFQRPFGLAFAADGTLYVSTDNDMSGGHSLTSGTVWRVDVAAKTAAPVANAIGRPRGIVALPDGRLAAADYLHHVVEIVDPATGQVTIIAGAPDVPGYADGDGTTARFSAPYGIGLRADGTLIVADYGNARLRIVALDGTTSTLSGAEAGYADGTLATARFDHPQGISIAADGSVFVTDTGNFRVRRIDGDAVTTVAGDGTGGWHDDDDPLASSLYGLEGLSVVPDGSMVYVADGGRGEDVPYNRVRQVKLQ